MARYIQPWAEEPVDPLEISVTEEMIRIGERKSFCHCPIALAFREVLAFGVVARVECEFTNFLRVDPAPGRSLGSLRHNRAVLMFIHRFDEPDLVPDREWAEVEPFTFVVNRHHFKKGILKEGSSE